MGMALVSPLVCWILLSVVRCEKSSQYCSAKYRAFCQNKGLHVACQFPMEGPGPMCEQYSKVDFPRDLRVFITHYINRRRQRLAEGREEGKSGVEFPRSQIMMLVEWNHELASLAQRLADQCRFAHDFCRATVRYPYAGQTVGEVRWRGQADTDSSTMRGLRRVLDAWWDERRRATPEDLSRPFRITPRATGWGHFSQMAVWSLRAVGCGAARSTDDTNSSKLLVVCDYSHNNMLGQPTILPGPMMACPAHMVRRQRSLYPMLCAPVSPLDELQNEDESLAPEVIDVPLVRPVLPLNDPPVKPHKHSPHHKLKEEQNVKHHNHSHSNRRKPGTILFDTATEESDVNVVRPFQLALPSHKQKEMVKPVPLHRAKLPSEYTPPRAKWRPRRIRPQRPGQAALLSSAIPRKYYKTSTHGLVFDSRNKHRSTEASSHVIEIKPRINLMKQRHELLDKRLKHKHNDNILDSEEQLFRDTGFRRSPLSDVQSFDGG